MKSHHAAALSVVLGLAVSCTQDAGPESASNNTNRALGPTPQPAALTANQAASEPPPPNIPKDAQWTISCFVQSGPDHGSITRHARAKLIDMTKMRDFYVVHGEGLSTLYYGFYRAVQDDVDPAEAARAHADRKKLLQVMDPTTGTPIFRSAMLVPLDGEDIGPPEWNLVNGRGAFTLQIALYKGHPQRKQYAVDVVREARAQGVEAYYFHGPTASAVCIGAWPESAVFVENDFQANAARDGRDAILLAAPGLGEAPEGMKTADGRPIKVVQAKYEIKDPAMLAIARKFDRHATNGVDDVVGRTKAGEVVYKRSLVVRIPQRIIPDATANLSPPSGQANGLQLNNAAANTNPPRQKSGPTAVKPKTPSGGQLKGLDD